FADTDAAQDRVRHLAAIGGKSKMRRLSPRRVIGGEAEVLVDVVGLDDLSRVHLPFGILDRFEFAERLHQLGAEHLRQQVRARLTVAMLARERAAIRENQVGRFIEKRTKLPDPFGALKVEVVSRMNATLSEVAIE